MTPIVNMFLEKVFNLGYLDFSHEQLLLLVVCGQRRISFLRTCASRLIEEEKQARFL
jgi:hypothetical protein